jgi:CheY-like chemotaxis protein
MKKLNCILLVDDDEATNFFNQMVIKKAGIAEHIETVLNGKEAIDYLTNSGKFENREPYPQPELIFLDINMPVMDGWDFLENYRKLNENEKGQKIIVMLTTSLNPDDATRAKAITEITDFKSKPLFAEAINEVIRQYFPDRL